MVYRLICALVAMSAVYMVVAGHGSTRGSERAPATSRFEEQVRVLLPFATVAQGGALGGDGARPFLWPIGTDTQRSALVARLSAKDRSRLAAVDLSVSVVLAAFQGLQSTSGYRIDILTVDFDGEVLGVTVKHSSPIPGEPVRQGFESPYHVVQVPRHRFDTHFLTRYRLRDASGILLEEGPIVLMGPPRQ